MASDNRGEALAQILVLVIAVAAFNNYRSGNLGAWVKAKLTNDGAPAPAGTTSVADIFRGLGLGSVTGTTSATSSAAPASDAAGMVTVGTMKMSPRMAIRYQAMAAAAAKDGITLTGGAWRSGQRQFELRGEHGCKGREYDRSCKATPPTAIPGTSMHETGDAIDFDLGDPRVYPWLVKNAGKYGIHQLPSERWHWSINGK